ncbi:MAG: hypothetical protein A2541_01860 [Candidatus Taylorbacteria bacterium RIFOXYD2_FULL_36_9]|uniref:Uncharacterized protein n=1 Tax=Candidatus Taylorbacteria bacterium RIFOXYD2_FULL_36_9 TaxID=1802338 RepID=A0A1G2PG88_9BACT|nr:MAG: hypothetical protein A2541_01860 [Candidatus Taylorbacteria bacterium RIFOXYD2_FULL_36_9]
MIKLDIKYSLEYEKERIESTLDKAGWYLVNGYSKWIKLPDGKKLDEIDIISSRDYLLDTAEKEYDLNDYEKIKNIINEQWFKFTPKLEKYFIETSLKQEAIYIIQLTKYGVGGSYNFPNKVILNFQNKSEIALFRNAIHEIIHLSIQSFIDENKVDHWVKERIVDLILRKIDPESNIMQKISIDTQSIDLAFEKHYPNIEKIIKNI